MASLERRNGHFRVVFRYAGQKFSRSLKTRKESEAQSSFARLVDNLRRAELGHLQVSEGADIAAFLLSDGRIAAKPSLPKIRTLSQLFDAYMASVPEGAIEETTREGMEIHIEHLRRVLGDGLPIAGLTSLDLQRYVDARALAKGIRGRSLSAATIKKELITLRTAWNWAKFAGLLQSGFPLKTVKFPKSEEKPPFQTWEEIERIIARAGVSSSEERDLWDSLFLTVPDIEELLNHVRRTARHPFIYPMFLFAAHTGARRSEMIRSCVHDIDFECKTALIREKKRVRGKTSTRRVPLSPELLEALRAWIAAHPGGIPTFCHDLDVVRSKTARSNVVPLTPHEAHDHFKRTLADSKWSKLRGWHVLRHSFCSNCAARGIDQRIINRWVGHQTQAMVERYQHLIPNQQQEAICLVFGGKGQ
jgi:integrase